MLILTEEEKRSIKSEVEAMPLSERHKQVRQEIYAAVHVIKKTLGQKWYEKAFKNYLQEDDIKKTGSNAEDLFYLNPSVRLLSDFLIGEYPEIYLKICQFAYFINELWTKTNVKVKIDDYIQQERKRDLSLENFQKFFFELETAFFWLKNNFDVEFIPKSRTETPDFKIVTSQGITFIECKKKNDFNAIEQRFEKSARNISNKILEYMQKLRVNFEIEIKVEKEITLPEIDSIVSVIDKVFASGVECFAENLGSISIQGKKLENYGVTQLLKDIPDATKPPPSLGTKFIFELFNPLNERRQIISTFGCPNVKPFPIDTPITNFKRVIFHAAFIPNKVQTILYSLEDTSQLRLSGVGGSILAIETALNESKEGQILTKQVFDSLPKIAENMPHVSAFLLLTTGTGKDDENQSMKAYKVPRAYINPFATHTLPENVDTALREGKCSYNISFFN
jgi:hypothetical protein